MKSGLPLLDLMTKQCHYFLGLDTAAKSRKQQELQPVPRLRPFCAGITFEGRVDFLMEEWKAAVGYEGFYEVSDQGRVRACFFGNHGQFKPGRMLKLQVSNNGYFRVELNVPDRKPHKRTVHSLVLEAFHGPRPQNNEARHLDGIRSNNSKNNLAWGTKSENAHDAIRHGTFNLGERHPMAKLSKESIPKIRKMRAEGLKYEEIAQCFGVDQSNICCIIKGKTWMHV